MTFQEKLDPAMENSAHLVLWIDQSGRIVDMSITSDEKPTMVSSHARPLVIRKVSGVGIGYEMAHKRLFAMAQSDLVLSQMMNMRSMRGRR